MTKGDKLRNMTNEELAQGPLAGECGFCSVKDIGSCEVVLASECIENIIKYLESEDEE